MPICSTSSNYHQPTHTSLCILLAPTSPMPCTTYHHHSNPALSYTQATKPTHKATISQAINAMHHLIGLAPPVAAQHQNPSLLTKAFLYHGLGALCGARCLHMLPFIMLIILNSAGRPNLSPSKSSQELHQICMRSHWCVEKTQSQVTRLMLPKHSNFSCHHNQQLKLLTKRQPKITSTVKLESHKGENSLLKVFGLSMHAWMIWEMLFIFTITHISHSNVSSPNLYFRWI